MRECTGQELLLLLLPLYSSLDFVHGTDYRYTALWTLSMALQVNQYQKKHSPTHPQVKNIQRKTTPV